MRGRLLSGRGRISSGTKHCCGPDTLLVDQRRADYRSAEAKAQHAEAALAQAKAPMGREREIEAQRAAVEAARAALAMAEWRLAQRTATSGSSVQPLTDRCAWHTGANERLGP